MSSMPNSPVVNVVVQARASSTRLPGKVLRSLGGRSVLGWVVRAAIASAQGRVIVATSEAADDDAVADEAALHGAEVVRGPLDDVLGRFLLACELHPADAVVRLTADCPLHDPALIGQLTAMWLADPSLDYVSTTLVRTLPRGFDAELVRVPVLAEQGEVSHGPHREHVTYGVYGDPGRYSCAGLVVAPPADDLRVTLDTAADWDLLTGVVAELGDRPPRWQDVVALLRARPDLVALNADVEQKEAGSA
ncbi:spore coat protein [Prauserella marina]|uniref:Spore coat polysaccharide biosynthesis protein SpsF n=1 Tax=Prauserella marina TaxID=530584 RepID=A0A222VIR3_9PSEU|nr:spore coat protein [Prauserella marina]ASR33787.1 spore coat protein [Prauserella marina]PWV82364.1 spore coat polysaccharide biosynthesis protein SpsF [Prauserella marina]SDC67402.1 spore coat polysaccharide biosynthesis protein SpsF [Prauserella marina]